MAEGRRAGGASDRDEKEGAWGGASRHADQHGQPGVDVLESRPMAGGRRAGRASDGDEKEGAWGGASRHADQHGQPASTYRNQGRWQKAEELDVQVMETSSRVLGAEHPSTLTSMANLASTYRNQGRWQEAEELDVQVIKTRKRVLGAEHPSTLTSMANLAWTLKYQDRDDEAIGLMASCKELCMRVLSPAHHHTQAVFNTLVVWQIARYSTGQHGGQGTSRMPGAWVD
jgi:Tetratricopeptide repeat